MKGPIRRTPAGGLCAGEAAALAKIPARDLHFSLRSSHNVYSISHN